MTLDLPYRKLVNIIKEGCVKLTNARVALQAELHPSRSFGKHSSYCHVFDETNVAVFDRALIDDRNYLCGNTARSQFSFLETRMVDLLLWRRHFGKAEWLDVVVVILTDEMVS